MKDFKIALVQHASPLGKKRQNLETTIAWARKAKKAGADLVVFPELSITGHGGHVSMIQDAEPVPDGECARALIELAHDLDIFICAGIAELDMETQYNCQFIVGPDGFIGKQRKLHLSGDEYFYFRHGTDLPVFELPFARIGIVICFDNGVPEVARTHAVKGAEVSLAVHAARVGKWPTTLKQRKLTMGYWLSQWRLLHPARARDNGCYVCLNNTVGQSARGIKGVEANHLGGLMVYGPNGRLVAENNAIRLKEEMLLVPLKSAPLHELRTAECFNIRVRRPESFGPLTHPTS
jgi:predicted amidohydrolase